jgi:uncharacterized protein (TIGR00297 family)
MQLLLGILLALIVSILAIRARALTRSGAAAATLLGTVIFGLGGLSWAVVLLAFFITSSGLSRLFGRRKSSLNEKFSKGSQRDAWQVLANGGAAGVFVLLHLVFPGSTWPWFGFAGSLAAANADTWATELGVLSRSAPRLITTGKPTERGTSGAISVTGTLAALAGGLLIGVFAAALWQILFPVPVSHPFEVGILRAGWIALAGLGGSLVDSLLGATSQVIYYCPACSKETERSPLHTCGTPTVYRRGLPWMDNDWVNILCTIAGGIFGAAAAFLL